MQNAKSPSLDGRILLVNSRSYILHLLLQSLFGGISAVATMHTESLQRLIEGVQNFLFVTELFVAGIGMPAS